MAPAGAPAHRRPCVNCARQSPPLVHVRVYIHIDIHIPANSSRLDRRETTRSDSRSPSRLSRWPVGRAAVVIPTGGRIATGRAEPRSGEGGGAKAEAGNMEGDGGRRAAKRKRAVNAHEHCVSCASARNACLDAKITSHRVSQPLAPRAGTEATGCHDSYSRRNCCGSGSRRNRWRYGPWATALRYRLLARSAVSSTHVKRHGSHHRADAVEPAPLSIGSSIAIR